MTRKLRKGGYTAILSVVVIAAVILINLIVGKLPQQVRQFDLSGTQIYTLGDTTKKLLTSLDKDVTVYVVADPSTVDKRITNFLGRYTALSSHIKVVNVDSVLHPDQVKNLNAENKSLLVKCDATGKTETIKLSDIIKYDQMSYYYYGQMKETEFDGEGQLTGAISHVVNDVTKNIYATQGHGETPVGTMVTDLLKKSGLTIKTADLLKNGGIPKDCDLLILNAPVSDLANDEKTMLTDYLNSGKSVLLIASYSDKERPNLDSVLKDYGLKLDNGLIADTKNFYQNNPYFIFPVLEPGNEITTGLDAGGAALLLQSAGFSQLPTLPDQVTVTPFMETSDGGVLVTPDGRQTPGTYLLGAVAKKKLTSGTAAMTVIGSPSLIDDSLNKNFTNLVNLELFTNAVTANFSDVTNVSIPSKSLQITYNTVTHGGTWGILFVLIIPILTIGIGLTVWLKRRRL